MNCKNTNMKLPVEIEQLIREYAEPIYKKPLHLKAIKPMFIYMKRMMMKDTLYWTCPSSRNPFLQTTFNLNYRRAHKKYVIQQIGEIYEELYEDIWDGNSGSSSDNLIGDVLNFCQQCDTDLLTLSESKPINCMNKLAEMLIIIIINYYLLLFYFLFLEYM